MSKQDSGKRRTLMGSIWRRVWMLVLAGLALYFGVNAVVLLFDALADGRSLRWIVSRQLFFVIPFALALQQFLRMRQRD